MKAARIVVLVVAVAAGGLAFMLSRGRSTAVQAPVATNVTMEGVLVARRDIGVGQNLVADDLVWEQWPKNAVGDVMIRQSARPGAVDELKGAVARGTFVTGEPIREQKLIRAGGSGFMSAILPSGMRAVSTEVQEDKRAGGFILPNDRVDVMLTRKDPEAQKRNVDAFITETVLTNVRVLAIGQTIEDKEGQRSVAGKASATLELTPQQAEILAQASEAGTLALALRSLADSSPSASDHQPKREASSMSIVRFGIPSIATTR
ncbi:Flp pilus assembly protein CpaB [Ancylobacter terrae]|uniref:Flp pilus assembly protein CpaB n=1 Tax=Ancylobacter sp. sgz301288 TaxID=3342077 RepID=UPI00385CF287